MQPPKDSPDRANNDGIQSPDRCQIEPQPHHQFRFLIDGQELTRWHFADDAPRPYFFPVRGPSGAQLTRMGHPGAPDHDHHRSLWFAHHDLIGISFWSDGTPARIEQPQWYAIEDGPEFARIAFELVGETAMIQPLSFEAGCFCHAAAATPCG